MVERSAVMSLGIARWLMWWKLSCCQARVVASVARMRRRILAMADGSFGGRFGRSGDVSVAKEREREMSEVSSWMSRYVYAPSPLEWQVATVLSRTCSIINQTFHSDCNL